MNKISSLKLHLDRIRIKSLLDKDLSTYTTIGIGGNASLVTIAETSLQFEQAILWATRLDVPYLIIGNGSNLIISDDGFNGFVIVNRSQNWQIVEGNNREKNLFSLQKNSTTSSQPKFLNEEEKENPDPEEVLILVDSGIQVRSLTNALYKYGITGLEWYAGIPASVGGAIYMNMHGGTYFFGDIINRVLLLSGREKKIVDRNYFKFGYDYSILHKTKEIILRAELILKRGDVKKARIEGKNWAKQKSFQPQHSAGCIFHNLTNEQQRKLKLPTPSVGYFIDKILKLSGTRIGNAIISTRHAAFIENTGNAKAEDVYKLIHLIKKKAKDEYRINLKLEVELIGNFRL